MGKARVTPIKTITIPRLELTAAVVSVKVSEVVKRELKYNITKNCSGQTVRLSLDISETMQEDSIHTLPIVLNKFEAKPRKNSGDISTQILILLMTRHMVLPPNNH